MRIQVLQHVPFEGLGAVEGWANARAADVHVTRLFAGDAPPALDQVDMVVALGGPMSVNDEGVYPWLVDEKRFVRDAVTRGVPVVGICLGAQLIASALGARVYPMGEREIGWFPVTHLPAPDVALDGSASTPFHWHGETFDLPDGAVRLASTPLCANQAFVLQGRPVIGLQFHLEATPETVAALVEHCRDELTPSRYVQTEDALRSVPPSVYAEANGLMQRALDRLALAAGRTSGLIGA